MCAYLFPLLETSKKGMKFKTTRSLNEVSHCHSHCSVSMKHVDFIRSSCTYRTGIENVFHWRKLI